MIFPRFSNCNGAFRRIPLLMLGLTALGGVSLSVVAPAAYAQNLKQTAFEDGTGSIGLAPGFKITEAYRGTVTTVNPDGSAVILGMPWVVTRSDSPITNLPGADRYPQAMPGDLVTALRQVLAKNTKSEIKSLRSRPAPSALPGVPAVYFLYEFVQNGKAMTGLGYFTPLIYGGDSPSWQLYSSAVVAPTSIFVKKLPTMMAMWRSWRPNGQKPKAGSESAKLDEILEHRRESMEQINKQFGELLRN